jgi:hypothetical protein
MGLFLLGSGFNWQYHNGGTNPSATPGTSVTPGASNAEGSWTSIATGSNIANDVFGVLISVAGGNTSAAQKDHLLDIGVDPAGGTSYTALISNIVCGQSDAANRNAKTFFFPMFIKAGSQVAVRVQGNNATAGTVRIWATFYGKPSRPELQKVGFVSETIGTISSSGGVSFTPGNAADGSWVSLGTTSRPLWWFQIGCQLSNATSTAQYTYVDLAVGDGSNKDIIINDLLMSFSGTAEVESQPYMTQIIAGYRQVPAGATLYVRGRCNTAPASGYNAVAIGVG